MSVIRLGQAERGSQAGSYGELHTAEAMERLIRASGNRHFLQDRKLPLIGADLEGRETSFCCWGMKRELDLDDWLISPVSQAAYVGHTVMPGTEAC